jgi:hypothetical protein
MNKASFSLIAACVLSSSALAQQTAYQSTIPVEPRAASHPVNHILQQTLIDQGPSGGTLPKPGSYTFNAATPFTCKAACTLEVDIMLQIGQNTTTGNVWDICAQVDQSGSKFQCSFQGTLPTDKSYVVGNYAYSVSLKKGRHVVQGTVLTQTGAAALGAYHALYRVYQP